MSDENENENEGMSFEGGDDSLMVDLTGIEEDKGFEAVPRGNYSFVVDDVEFRLSKDKNNPMWSFTLLINEGDYAGRKLFTHAIFTEKMMGRTKRLLGQLGCTDLLSGPFDPRDEAVMNQVRGKFGIAVTGIREYNGNLTNEVKQVKSVGGAGEGSFSGI